MWYFFRTFAGAKVYTTVMTTLSHSEKEAIMTYDEIMASIYDFKALTNRGK